MLMEVSFSRARAREPRTDVAVVPFVLLDAPHTPL